MSDVDNEMKTQSLIFFIANTKKFYLISFILSHDSLRHMRFGINLKGK